MLKQRRNLLFLSIVIIFLIGLSIILLLVRQKTNTQSHATTATSLFLTPTTPSATVNKPLQIVVTINPSTNAVSLVTLDIKYDPTKFSPPTPLSDFFVPNINTFPQVLQGPTQVASGEVEEVVSIGSNPVNAVVAPTNVGTFTLVPIAVSATPSEISWGPSVNVLSIAAGDNTNENVLAAANVTSIEINPATISSIQIAQQTLPAATIGVPLYLSALAYDSQNNPLFNGITYQWGISSVASIGSLDPLDQNITTFTPENVGSGDIYVIATSGTQQVTKSVPVDVLAPVITPTPPFCPTFIECTAPPLGCSYVGGNSCTCGTLACTSVSPTITPTNKFSVTLFLHDIGNAGDTVTQDIPGNMNPVRTVYPLAIELDDINNDPIATASGVITWNSVDGDFVNTSFDFGTLIPTGSTYNSKVIVPGFLEKKVSKGPFAIQSGQTITFQPLYLTNGDINNDNVIDLLDYNVFLSCYSDILPAQPSCTSEQNSESDLNDDGVVNGIDYNAWVREISKVFGD